MHTTLLELAMPYYKVIYQTKQNSVVFAGYNEHSRLPRYEAVLTSATPRLLPSIFTIKAAVKCVELQN